MKKILELLQIHIWSLFLLYMLVGYILFVPAIFDIVVIWREGWLHRLMWAMFFLGPLVFFGTALVCASVWSSKPAIQWRSNLIFSSILGYLLWTFILQNRSPGLIHLRPVQFCSSPLQILQVAVGSGMILFYCFAAGSIHDIYRESGSGNPLQRPLSRTGQLRVMLWSALTLHAIVLCFYTSPWTLLVIVGTFSGTHVLRTIPIWSLRFRIGSSIGWCLFYWWLGKKQIPLSRRDCTDLISIIESAVVCFLPLFFFIVSGRILGLAGSHVPSENAANAR